MNTVGSSLESIPINFSNAKSGYATVFAFFYLINLIVPILCSRCAFCTSSCFNLSFVFVHWVITQFYRDFVITCCNNSQDFAYTLTHTKMSHLNWFCSFWLDPIFEYRSFFACSFAKRIFSVGVSFWVKIVLSNSNFVYWFRCSLQSFVKIKFRRFCVFKP